MIVQKKLTITIDATVYDGLHRAIGRGKISQFIENLVRPHVTERELERSYEELAAYEADLAEPGEWMDVSLRDVAAVLDETR